MVNNIIENTDYDIAEDFLERRDLAAMFVQGGTATLNKIANQGGYTTPNFNQRMLAEGFDLPTDLDIQAERLTQFIGSLFLPIFKKRAEYGKTKTRSQIVMQHKDYRLAKKYRDGNTKLFSIKRKITTGAIFGNANLTIHSRNGLLPDIYLKITDGFSSSTHGMVNIDDMANPRVFILIDKRHFIEFFERSVDELRDTLKHELRHYVQFTGHSMNYLGLPKLKTMSNDADVLGLRHDTERMKSHHMRDIEFKPNVHTYSHYIKMFLNKAYPRSKWMEIFEKLVTGKPVYTGGADLDNFLDNLDDMRRKDKSRWIQFVKEMYKEIFNK